MPTFSFHPALTADVVVPATLDFGAKFLPQVQKILESAGSGLRDASEIALPGQAVAAILAISAIEMIGGLGNITLYSFGQKVERVGVLNLNTYRHQEVRSHRGEIPLGAAYKGFNVLDGSGRGLTPGQLNELADSLGIEVGDIRVVDINVGQVDFTNPTKGMVEKLLLSGLTVSDWSERRVLYLPAGSGLASVCQATTIYGLSESWPRTIRLVAGSDKVFHLAEVVDPQDMRQWGANLVAKWMADQNVTIPRELLVRLVNAFEKSNDIVIGGHMDDPEWVHPLVQEVHKYL